MIRIRIANSSMQSYEQDLPGQLLQLHSDPKEAPKAAMIHKILNNFEPVRLEDALHYAYYHWWRVAEVWFQGSLMCCQSSTD